MLSFFPLYAALRQIKVYNEFVEGAKEGYKTIIAIIPNLVAILVAIGMFRGAGGIDILTDWRAEANGVCAFSAGTRCRWPSSGPLTEEAGQWVCLWKWCSITGRTIF